MDKNIVLTGFMGTGKTAVGKELAELTGFKLIDMDTEIELAEKRSIGEIFQQDGETHFRNIETGIIRRFSRQQGVIISTGGGAVLREENLEALREHGIIFCLTAEPGTILERTRNSSERPLLQVEDPLKRINDLLDKRRPFYEKAGIMIRTDEKSPGQIAREILEIARCTLSG